MIIVIDKSTIYNKNIQKHHLEAKFGKSEATLFYATFKVEEFKVSSDFLIWPLNMSFRQFYKKLTFLVKWKVIPQEFQMPNC